MPDSDTGVRRTNALFQDAFSSREWYTTTIIRIIETAAHSTSVNTYITILKPQRRTVDTMEVFTLFYIKWTRGIFQRRWTTLKTEDEIFMQTVNANKISFHEHNGDDLKRRNVTQIRAALATIQSNVKGMFLPRMTMRGRLRWWSLGVMKVRKIT